MERIVPCPHCGTDVDRTKHLKCPNPSCRRSIAVVPRRPRVEPATDHEVVGDIDDSALTGGGRRVCQTPGCGATLASEAVECPYCGERIAADRASSLRVTVAGAATDLRSGETLNLGRDDFSPLADALAALDHISRRHARLECRGDGMWITDLGSSNGTYLDDRRLDPYTPERVEAGMPVRLASNVAIEIVRPEAPIEGRTSG